MISKLTVALTLSKKTKKTNTMYVYFIGSKVVLHVAFPAVSCHSELDVNSQNLPYVTHGTKICSAKCSYGKPLHLPLPCLIHCSDVRHSYVNYCLCVLAMIYYNSCTTPLSQASPVFDLLLFRSASR